MILASGCFDGLHAGHVRYLQAASDWDRTQPLVVAIAPDSYIRDQKHRDPYWTQMERALTVLALRCVDWVYLQEQGSVATTIRGHKPTVVVKGEDWRDCLPDDVVAAIHDVGAVLVFTETDGTHVHQARR